MSKEMFTEKEHWTNEASKLEAECILALKLVFEKWIAKGYKSREIAYVAQCALTYVDSISVIDNPVKKK